MVEAVTGTDTTPRKMLTLGQEFAGNGTRQKTIIRDNYIVSTRVVLPISDSIKLPARFGLRHRAAIGVTEKTDALCLLVSEETGEISYIKDGEFVLYSTPEVLNEKLKNDLM